MKLVLVANTAWSIYNFRAGLIKRLISAGIKVIVVSPFDAYSDKLTSLGCDVVNLSFSAKGVSPVKDLIFLIKLVILYKKISPDLIIHYTIKPNIYGSIAAKLLSIPSLAITTGLGYTFINNNLVSKIARYLYKFAFKFPYQVWFLNEDDKSIFIKNGLVSESKALILNGEGVDLDFFKPMKGNSGDSSIRFLLIARMLWDKGIREFVEAARMVKKSNPDIIFQLLGPCDSNNPSSIGREQIDLWESSGLIEYLGVTDDVRAHIALADCIVLPSYREGIPRTLIEAAAMEKPLITTDAPGCRDVVLDNVTGFICEVKNVESLVFCFDKFINMSDEDRVLMGQAGQVFMKEKFDEQLIVEQYLKALKCFNRDVV